MLSTLQIQKLYNCAVVSIPQLRYDVNYLGQLHRAPLRCHAVSSPNPGRVQRITGGDFMVWKSWGNGKLLDATICN